MNTNTKPPARASIHNHKPTSSTYLIIPGANRAGGNFMRHFATYFVFLCLLATLPACSIIDAQEDAQDSHQPDDVKSDDTSAADVDASADTTPEPDANPAEYAEDARSDADETPDADAVEDTVDDYNTPGDHKGLNGDGHSCGALLSCREACSGLICQSQCINSSSDRAQEKFDDYQRCASHYCAEVLGSLFESCINEKCDRVLAACESDTAS